MNYLEEAKELIERSQGDVRNEEHKQRLTQLAMAYAAIAQAEALVRIADQLEHNTATDEALKIWGTAR